MKRVLILSVISIASFACSPTYQSVRAYIPQHTEAEQLSVELGMTQADISYSLTDNLQVNAGGVYDEKIDENLQDEETASYKTTSVLTGGHLGLGYFRRLSSKKTQVISLNAGTAVQKWTYKTETSTETLTTGYQQFNADIINPYAQLAYSIGNQVSNLAFGIRYEQPLISFRGANNESLDDGAKPALINFLVQSKVDLSDRFSLFGQFILRQNLDEEHFTSDESMYAISSFNLYFGVSYAMGFKPTLKDEKSQVVVEHEGEE